MENKTTLLERMRQDLEKAQSELDEREKGISDMREYTSNLRNAVSMMEGNFRPETASPRGHGRSGPRGPMSAEGRQRIVEAQKRRWDRIRALKAASAAAEAMSTKGPGPILAKNKAKPKK